MSTIAQDVFTIAMSLMDEISQDGTFDGYPDYYKNKSWPILTTLQAQLLPANLPPLAITGPTIPLQIDDKAAIAILPYGLAAHLLMTEDMNRASFFNNTFDELKRTRGVQIIPIVDVLGVGGPTQAPDIAPSIDGDDSSFFGSDNGEYDGGEWE